MKMFGRILKLGYIHTPFTHHVRDIQQKKDRPQNPLKQKTPFKWVFMNIIPSTSPKSLTSETNFSNYLLIVDVYSNPPKLYGMEKLLHHK